MTVRKILTYPDEILRKKSCSVSKFDSQLAQIIDDMFDTMYQYEGIGLAGNQIGIDQQIIVIEIPESKSRLEIVNPILELSNEKIDSDEGCLSIPGYRDVIERSALVKLKAQNRKGEFFELEANELLARCIQHEVDHLNGILFVDHLSRLKKQFFDKWFKKNSPLG